MNEVAAAVQTKSACAVLLAFALLTAPGCCFFGASSYTVKSRETWKKLERGLHSGPTSVDQEQTGVTIQLPLLFDPQATQSFRPGTVVDNEPVITERVQPPGFTLPGLRFACQMFYANQQGQNLPVTCYLAVVAKGNAERDKVKQQLLASAKKVDPAVAWETLDGSTLRTERLSVSGSQPFLQPRIDDPKKAVETEGRLDLYVVAGEHANVIVGWRAPVDIAQRLSFFDAAEAAVATIKSEKPPAPVAPTPSETTNGASGDYVQAPNTNVELVPPEGFTPAETIHGFEKTGTSANIVVTEQPHPYSTMINSYNDQALQPYNISVLAREDVAEGDQPRMLLLLQKEGQTYWNLVFGDDSSSFVVTGTLDNPEGEAEKAAMRAALLTARKRQ